MDTAAVLGAAAGPRLRTDPSNVTRPHRDPAITHLCVTPVASGIRPHGTRQTRSRGAQTPPPTSLTHQPTTKTGSRQPARCAYPHRSVVGSLLKAPRHLSGSIVPVAGWPLVASRSRSQQPVGG